MSTTASTHRVLEAAHGLALVSLDPDPAAAPVRVTVPPTLDVVCGDVVTLDASGAHIVARAPRKSALVRARMNEDADAGAQVICANVDVVAVCAPLDRPVSARFLERGVAVAHASGARPLVILTKRDVLDSGSLEDAVGALHLPDVDVLAVSALDRDDVDIVRALVGPGETLALLGASGAGKSTLANALVGEVVQRTGDVQESAKGRHTTTGARLLALPPREEGAYLVDTAGIRTLGLVGDEDDVGAAFPDIDALGAGCRFRDCAHEREPGCAVRRAVDEGALEAGRLASFHALLREARRRGRAPWEPDPRRSISRAAKLHARDKRR